MTMRGSETHQLRQHLARLNSLIDSNRLRDFSDQRESSSSSSSSSYLLTKRLSSRSDRTNSKRVQQRPQSKRPMVRTMSRPKSSSRRLAHKSTLSRPSTATNRKPSSAASLRRQRSGSRSPRPSTASSSSSSYRASNQLAYGSSSLRPTTERQRSPPSNTLDGGHSLRGHSPIQFTSMAASQNSMLAMSRAVSEHTSQMSPNARALSSATTDLAQLRAMVERSKSVLLNRIDALLYNAGNEEPETRAKSSRSRVNI